MENKWITLSLKNLENGCDDFVIINKEKITSVLFKKVRESKIKDYKTFEKEWFDVFSMEVNLGNDKQTFYLNSADELEKIKKNIYGSLGVTKNE